MQMRITVTGVEELTRHLQALGLEVSDLDATFERLARTAATAAIAAAPRRSGRLAASIRPVVSRNMGAVIAGGAAAPYAAAINYGSHRRHIAPRRFMQRADAAIRPAVVPALERAINQAIAAKGL